eukprot:GGOE01053798.1.p1 GENE.GGOE01053798.1~~GGOE01053798.1.p1  ORF type:complete len:260 (+),score=91.63 GGOE01053798.1:85-864(+)
MRRKVGVAGIQANAAVLQKMREQGQLLSETSTKALLEQMDVFRSKLQEFAAENRHQINRNPEFRHEFLKMCSSLGVDPLASTKGFWAELLGYGDFYYELAIQIIEVCLSTRKQNGGLVPLAEITAAVEKRRPSSSAISERDVEEAVAKVSILGSGFKVLRLEDSTGAGKLVQSVPLELTGDNTTVLALAQKRVQQVPVLFRGKSLVTVQCSLTVDLLAEALTWPPARASGALTTLLQIGMAWLDEGDVYFFPTFCKLTS